MDKAPVVKVSYRVADSKLAELVYVHIEKSESGLYHISSNDVPGLGFSHSNLDRILGDLPNVISLIYKHNLHQEVNVIEYPAGSHQQTPVFG